MESNDADALIRFPPCEALVNLLLNDNLDDQGLQWVLRDYSMAGNHVSQSARGSVCDVPKSANCAISTLN